jgi:hypothetical protein
MGFELVPGLKVNFFKRNLIEVNTDPFFMNLVSKLLKCRIALLPFTYLGVPMGASPRLVAIWFSVFNSE